jgi:hypothetical protein
MNPFLLLLMSHILGDVIFASNRLAVLKRKPKLLGQVFANGFHSCIHAFFAGLFFFMAGRGWVWAFLLVLAFHFLIDFNRCSIEKRLFGLSRELLGRKEVMALIFKRKKAPKNIPASTLIPWFLVNISDQAAHLGSLYVISIINI